MGSGRTLLPFPYLAPRLFVQTDRTRAPAGTGRAAPVSSTSSSMNRSMDGTRVRGEKRELGPALLSTSLTLSTATQTYGAAPALLFCKRSDTHCIPRPNNARLGLNRTRNRERCPLGVNVSEWPIVNIVLSQNHVQIPGGAAWQLISFVCTKAMQQVHFLLTDKVFSLPLRLIVGIGVVLRAVPHPHAAADFLCFPHAVLHRPDARGIVRLDTTHRHRTFTPLLLVDTHACLGLQFS